MEPKAAAHALVWPCLFGLPGLPCIVAACPELTTPSTLGIWRSQVTRSAGVSMAISKPSNALPFLTAPACQSSGLPGAETGFDPLYFSDFLDIKWLREAELKHGRVCMLATTGYFLQEFYSLPNYPGYSANPVEAFSSVPSEGLLQIVIFMGWLEVIGNKGKVCACPHLAHCERSPLQLLLHTCRIISLRTHLGTPSGVSPRHIAARG